MAPAPQPTSRTAAPTRQRGRGQHAIGQLQPARTLARRADHGRSSRPSRGHAVHLAARTAAAPERLLRAGPRAAPARRPAGPCRRAGATRVPSNASGTSGVVGPRSAMRTSGPAASSSSSAVPPSSVVDVMTSTSAQPLRQLPEHPLVAHPLVVVDDLEHRAHLGQYARDRGEVTRPSRPGPAPRSSTLDHEPRPVPRPPAAGRRRRGSARSPPPCRRSAPRPLPASRRSSSPDRGSALRVVPALARASSTRRRRATCTRARCRRRRVTTAV